MRLATGPTAGGLSKLLFTQVILTGVVFAGFWVRAGLPAAMPVWAGGLAAVANMVWLHWRRWSAANRPALNAEKSLMLLYRTVLERFAVVVLLLYLAMGPLGLDPGSVVAGFVAGQLGLIVAGNTIAK